MRLATLLLGRLTLVMMLVTACDASVASDAAMGSANDPVPLPAELAAHIAKNTNLDLSPPDGSVPAISATKALEIAGEQLLIELDGNRVPRQDPSAPNALVRRFIPLDGASAWIVAYRWQADFNCAETGGPAGCVPVSVYVINDETGEIIYRARFEELYTKADLQEP